MSIAATLPSPARVSARAAFGLAIAALALGGTGVIASTAAGHVKPATPAVTTTHTNHATTTSTANGNSANAFGQSVVDQVKSCKGAAATNGKQGIGSCVSSWVIANNPSNTNGSSANHGSAASSTGRTRAGH